MTHAENRGFTVGNQYRIIQGRGVGTVVTLRFDDGSDYPKFTVPSDYDTDGWSFISLNRLGPLKAAVETPVEPAAVHINLNGNSTTIVVQRNLSADEVAAVLKAINAA